MTQAISTTAPEDDAQAAPQAVFYAVTGNCQAMFVACVLNTLPNAEATFFAGPYREVRFEGQSAATAPAAALAETLAQRKAAGARVVFCEQTSPIASPIELGVEVDAVVRFPNLQALALWPEAQYDAAQIARVGHARLHRIDIVGNAASAAKAEMSLQAFIAEHFQDRILFDSPRHR